MLLRDKSIIITGATKGIGRALAVAAGKAGAWLVLSGRNETEGRELEAEIGSGPGKAVFVKGDLTDVDCCAELAHIAVERYGKLDGLVNYAGTGQANTPFPDVDEEEFDWIMDVNFKSAFFTTQAAVKAMAGKGGSIVFMGSLHAYGGEIDRPAYACSKGAMYTLFRHMAKNYPRHMIRSNWVTIGWVATPGEKEFRANNGKDGGWLDETGRGIMPMGRLQKEDDYVDGVLYLLSDGAAQTTGSELFIAGGLTLH